MTKVGLFQFILLFLISPAFGQKVKYKDIFALLSAKQYQEAEPLLTNYLFENKDNPNALLYMGIILQEKSLKIDILKQTTRAIAHMDSAILYYNKAHKSLDDREIRRNKEFYLSYNRRDLRTGEIGVTLSDIHFDIEKKIEVLKERIDKVKMVKHYFSLADTTYKKANGLFISLQDKYPTLRQLQLRADESTVKDLNTLTVRYDSALKAFDNFQSGLLSIQNSGYRKAIPIEEIVEFEKDGVALPDFYGDQSKLWNYKSFADKTRQVIEKIVYPMRENLISYDRDMNQLREKMIRDSVSVVGALAGLNGNNIFDELKQFDPEPLPMMVLHLKQADLGYGSVLMESVSLKDSADIPLQFRMTNKAMEYLEKLDSVTEKISHLEVDKLALDYSHFITSTYSNTAVLKSYIRTQQEYCEREKKKLATKHAALVKSLKYMVDGVDSIPLFNEMSRPYKPLFTTDEKYTVGLCFPDALHVKGYFYAITPSRKPEMKAFFPVNKLWFNPGNFTETKALVYTDGGGQMYYVLVFTGKSISNKFPATLAKIYRSDGLAWSMNYELEFTPNDLTMNMDTGELVIKDGLHQTVLDKNGKVIH